MGRGGGVEIEWENGRGGHWEKEANAKARGAAEDRQGGMMIVVIAHRPPP
jgi:hypothetical protein